MGLDVYLYTAIDAAMNKQHSDALEGLHNDAEADGREVSTEEHRAVSEANPYASHADVPSERYPDHLFNRRYLRSSYNGGGFNHAVPEMIGTSGDYPKDRGSLYWIFEPMQRDWEQDSGDLTYLDVERLRECRARALEVADLIRTADRLRVKTIGPNMFSAPPAHTDDDALKIYRDHVEAMRERGREMEGWYASGPDLNVYADPLPVLCAIPGRDTFGIPAVHLIYRAEDEAYDSYVQSAEITAEFCDEAIALIERDGAAHMSWSG